MDANESKTFKNKIKLNIKENDLSLWIYKIEGAKFRDKYNIQTFINCYYNNIDYGIYGLFIIFWEKIEIYNMDINNKNIYFNLKESNNIKNYIYVKKRLLQQLIMNTIKNKQNNNNWKYIKDNIFVSNGQFMKIQEDNLEIYKKLNLSCKIDDNGYVCLYFNHCLFIVSLENLSQIGNIEDVKGKKMININSFSALIYKNTTTYKTNDINSNLGISFNEYFKDKKVLENIKDENGNIMQKIVNINNDENLILASYSNLHFIRQKEYYFPKQFIRLDKNYYRLKKEFK
jgi:hypothetical protein